VSADDADLVATASETVGPFFHFGLATDQGLGRVADASVSGEHITLLFRITDGDGQPVPDALVEIWQADGQGRNAVAGPSGTIPAFRGFGRLPTGEDGTCEFETVRPGGVGDGQTGAQAPHINVCLFARGLLRQLHTRVYFAGDPALEHDGALALVPPERRPTLIATPDPQRAGRWVFALRLQGRDETVFFDV
jgi:protocatechuate 3,4-dioxygenase, alpha subunit